KSPTPTIAEADWVWFSPPEKIVLPASVPVYKTHHELSFFRPTVIMPGGRSRARSLLNSKRLLNHAPPSIFDFPLGNSVFGCCFACLLGMAGQLDFHGE